MINRILKILKKNNIDEYIINESKKNVAELYLIKKDVNMSRKKQITDYTVTIFKNHEDGFKGNSKVDIFPSMDDDEISEVIKDAYYACSFVKNKGYKLPDGYNGEKIYDKSTLGSLSLDEIVLRVKNAIYKYDNYEKGCINSSEIFVTKTNKRIVTSNNVDASYEKYSIDGEIVAQWVENSDVEIFDLFSYDDLKEEELALKAKDDILNAMYRDKSKEAPESGKYNVILTQSSVHEFFKYYLLNSRTDMIYNKYSHFKINENVQGSNVSGDKINIKLKAHVPFSDEGIELKDTVLIENGTLKTIYGPYNYAQYLNLIPIGDCFGAEIKPGSITSDEMFKDGDLKIIRFSDFQMDEITGDCFGEIRLALLKKGNDIIPLTGGSISVNVKDVENDMVFSAEVINDGSVTMPQCIKFKNVEVAGK